jgi:GTP-binding protein LepA
MMSTQNAHEILEVGVVSPDMKPTEFLSAGEVGYVIPGVKNVRQARVGDTLTTVKNPATESLGGYQDAKPMVFSASTRSTAASTRRCARPSTSCA